VCLAPDKAVHEFLSRSKDDDTVLFLEIQSSPWNVYDGDGRILSPEDLGKRIRTALANQPAIKRVELRASWSGVRPTAGVPSIAERLSKALGGFPVSGADGFLWVKADGSLRTTRQAFTTSVGPYMVASDGQVMVSAVFKDVMPAVDAIRKKRDARLLRFVGVAWDVYGLCPGNALAAYEEAAALGDAIAAYNAALLHMERGTKIDLARAAVLLEQASKAGDIAARAKLAQMRSQVR